MNFNIESLKEKNTDCLKKYFIYVYQFSFNKNTFNEESIPFNLFLDNIIKKYKNLPLDRLWYALYFETTLKIIEPYNFRLLKTSIKNTLNQLSFIDFDFIEDQIDFIYKFLINGGFQLLLERPYLVMKNSEDPLFINIVETSEGLSKSIQSYESYFDEKKLYEGLIPCHIKDYQSLIENVIEKWSTFAYTILLDEILPIFNIIKYNENKTILINDLLNCLESPSIWETKIEDSPIDVNLLKSKLNNLTIAFIKQITKRKKDVKVLLPIFNKYNKKVINNYLIIINNK